MINTISLHGVAYPETDGIGTTRLRVASHAAGVTDNRLSGTWTLGSHVTHLKAICALKISAFAYNGKAIRIVDSPLITLTCWEYLKSYLKWFFTYHDFDSPLIALRVFCRLNFSPPQLSL